LYETKPGTNKQLFYGYIREAILHRGVRHVRTHYLIPHSIIEQSKALGATAVRLYPQTQERFFYESEINDWQDRGEYYYLPRKRMMKLYYRRIEAMKKVYARIPYYERYIR